MKLRIAFNENADCWLVHDGDLPAEGPLGRIVFICQSERDALEYITQRETELGMEPGESWQSRH
jgi:hypothetical protein